MNISHECVDHYGQATVTIEEVETCPLCHKNIQPEELRSYQYRNNNSDSFLSVLYLCKGCYNTFLTQYKLFLDGGKNFSKILFSGPQKYKEINFENEIKNLSPRFVQIYNEAAQAESLSMNEIAGIGYRKAFEILVKDFFIKLNPSDEARTEIIDTPLSKFFSDKNPSKYKLNNEMLNELAKASTWIGNDFVHYYRKHEDYNINDLKELIHATFSQISVELFTWKKAKKILGK